MTDWQQQYEKGETPWDKGEPAPALKEFFATIPLSPGRVLVPGCGTGQDVRALALAGATEAVGMDIAPLAVQRGLRFLAETQGASAIHGDFFIDSFKPPHAEAYDLIWEHTCYCAIPPGRRPEYVAAAAAALKPEGQLFGVFYLNPWDPDEDQTQGPPFGTGMEELVATFEQHFELVRGWRPEVAYPGREGREWCGIFQKKPAV